MARRSTTRGYRCTVCGKWHAELLTDIACRLPDCVWALDYLERYRRARYNEDLCTLDGRRHFIRCVLPVPFTHRKGDFGWGVWVEVSRRHHDAYVKVFGAPGAAGIEFPGTIANRLRAYRSTLGLAVTVRLSAEHRPLLQIEGSSRHRLALEQRRGIAAERHHEIVAPVLG